MAKKIKALLIWVLIFAVIGYAGGAALHYFTEGNQTDFLASLQAFDYCGLGAGAGAVLGMFVALTGKKKDKKPDAPTTGTTAGGHEMSLAYDAEWLKTDQFKNQFGLIDTTWSQLPSLKNTGIVFRNSLENGKYHVGMKDEYHCMIIGTTGSGKTSICFVPTIRILSHTGEKPCLVVSDPKGELFEKTSEIVKDEGYRVITLNLRDPFSSTRWNPMGHAFDLYHKGKDCKNNVKKCSNGTRPKDVGFKEIPGQTYGQEWFGFENIAYPTEEAVRVAVRSAEQVYCDMAQSELQEMCSLFIPDSQAQDKTWEEGARDFLFGCMMAMLEDSMIPELGMTKEKFNFYNLYKIATYRDPDPDAPFDTLRKYLLQGRDDATSVVPNKTAAVISNAPNTTKSYIGVLNGKVSFMSDIGIAYLTSESDIGFEDFMNVPTVMYLVIPDDREERYNLAILCISQLYKRLVDVANSCPGQKLPKHCYFILDEFGNLPKIPKFDSMITVSRGRNMLFEIVIQAYSQVETKYGAEAAKTIIGNCNAQIYLGTDDQKTREDFSKLCGDVQLTHVETSTGTSKSDKDKDGKSTSTNTSVQRTTRPLITPYELGQIPRGTVVVKLFRYNPMKFKATPNYETPFFYEKKALKPIGAMKSLDTVAVYYDIKMRNKKILKTTNPFDF